MGCYTWYFKIEEISIGEAIKRAKLQLDDFEDPDDVEDICCMLF